MNESLMLYLSKYTLWSRSNKYNGFWWIKLSETMRVRWEGGVSEGTFLRKYANSNNIIVFSLFFISQLMNRNRKQLPNHALIWIQNNSIIIRHRLIVIAGQMERLPRQWLRFIIPLMGMWIKLTIMSIDWNTGLFNVNHRKSSPNCF